MIYAGIDCGTQGTKVILWDARQKKIIASSYLTYDVISTRPGQKEQDPTLWLAAIKDGMNAVFTQAKISPSAITGLGVSGQQHGLVLLDENHHLLRPAKLWCDTESVEDLSNFLSEFELKHHETVSACTGINIPVAFTIAKLLWVKNHEPDIFSAIHKICLPHEYINLWLTGNHFAESGDASGTGYFDSFNRCWSRDIVDFIDPDLFKKLPFLIQSHEPAGYLTDNAAQVLGLPAGISVSSGGGDNMMSAIGTGNITQGLLTMSLGTSGTLFTHTERQVDSRKQTDINSFCSSSNGWLPLVSTMNVTSAVNSFRHLLDVPIEEFEDYIKQSLPGSAGLYCFPWFNGSRFPDAPHMKASLHGMTSSNFTKPNLLRCVTEGVTYKICKGIDEFRCQGLVFRQIRVIGGAAKSATWCQMIADISGLDVIRPAVTEAAAFGAALQAQWCKENSESPERFIPLSEILPPFLVDSEGDIFTPDRQQQEIYQKLYYKYHQDLCFYLQNN